MGVLSILKSAALKIAALIPRGSRPASGERRRGAGSLADRLLSDCLRLAELPSPTEKEEARAAFVSERLSAIGFPASVDGDGNVSALIARDGAERDPEAAEGPLLLFADLGTARWHPLGSFARVDARHAKGAGIADSLGAAALLSVAECVQARRLKPSRDLLLLFAARSLDDPRCGIFKELADAPSLRPSCALGLRGLTLGALASRPLGTYRIGIQVAAAGEGQQDAVSAVVAVAQRLGGVRWDAEGLTSCRIARIVAGTGFGRPATEGHIDLELESSDGNVLELAKKAVTATAETVGKESGAALSVSVLGHIPVGDPLLAAALRDALRNALKAQRIKVREQPGADPASFLSTLGIPALSVGLANGTEGLEADEIDIESIESGRRLLFALLEKADLR